MIPYFWLKRITLNCLELKGIDNGSLLEHPRKHQLSLLEETKRKRKEKGRVTSGKHIPKKDKKEEIGKKDKESRFPSKYCDLFILLKGADNLTQITCNAQDYG